ncbi:hypothetical protein ACHAP8_004078 [Fusarium lateritium]
MATALIELQDTEEERQSKQEKLNAAYDTKTGDIHARIDKLVRENEKLKKALDAPLGAGQVNGKAIEQKAIGFAHLSPDASDGLRNMMDKVNEENHTASTKPAATSHLAKPSQRFQSYQLRLHQPQRHPPEAVASEASEANRFKFV